MVILNGLRHVNHPNLALVVEEVVLTQIPMHQLAVLVEVAHHEDALLVEVRYLEVVVLADDGVLESWGGDALLADELHYDYVVFEVVGPGGSDFATHTNPLQIPHLLLRPQLNLLPRIALAVTAPEPELSLNVALAVLENQDARLEDLDGEFDVGVGGRDHLQRVEVLAPALGQVHIRLLARADAPVQLLYLAVLYQFMQDYQRARIQDLLHGGAVIFVFPDGIVHVVDLLEGGEEGALDGVRHLAVEILVHLIQTFLVVLLIFHRQPLVLAEIASSLRRSADSFRSSLDELVQDFFFLVVDVEVLLLLIKLAITPLLLIVIFAGCFELLSFEVSSISLVYYF